MKTRKTEVKVLYDNEGNLHFGNFTITDNKIQKEITDRDVFGVSDHFQFL
jgi:hypothetical protein